MSAGPGGDFPGVSMAVVADNEDPEGLGRVKVTFPWRQADDESYWARVAAPMAGPDRGAYFLPAEGDEVLVAFENGNLERPYVLGGLWNGQREPPEDNSSGDNDVATIRSSEGHEVVLDDADDGGVTVETADGQTVELSDESGGEAITITDSDGNELVFDPSSSEVSLSSTASLSIEATDIEMKADGNFSIESSGMLTLKGSLIELN